MEFLTELRWSPYVVGIGIGILSWLSFLISKQPLATSTSFARTSGMIEQLITGKDVAQKPYYKKIGLGIDWQWMLVVGVIVGSLISALFSGDFRLQWVPALWDDTFGGNVVLRVVVALVGGVLIGFGARWAGGCPSGHGISGTLQLAVSSWISAICFFIGGIIAAQIIFTVFG